MCRQAVYKSWRGIFRCFALDIFQQFIGTKLKELEEHRGKHQPAKRTSVLQPGHCPDKPKDRLIYKRESLFWGFFPWITCFLGLLGHLYNWLTLYFLSLSLKFILKKPNKPCLGCVPLLWCLFGVLYFFFPFVDLLIVVVVPFLGCVLFLWEDKSWCTALCTV